MTNTYNGASQDTGELELELRVLPGVMSVSMEPPGPDRSARVVVVALSPAKSLKDDVAQIAQLHLIDAVVEIVDPRAGGRATEPAPASERRVVLRRSEFIGDDGVSEVMLASDHGEGTGRVPMGPLIGGAAATLEALAQLGVHCPYYLQSASRVSAMRDAPVVVILRPLDGGSERVGVALAESDIEASSRATLNAVNRKLTR